MIILQSYCLTVWLLSFLPAYPLLPCTATVELGCWTKGWRPFGMPTTPPESLWRVTESLKSMVNRCHQRTGRMLIQSELKIAYCVKFSAFSFGSHGGVCMNPGIHWFFTPVI